MILGEYNSFFKLHRRNSLMNLGKITKGLARIVKDTSSTHVQNLVNESGEGKVIELAKKGFNKRYFLQLSAVVVAGAILWMLVSGCVAPSGPPPTRNVPPGGFPRK